MMVPSEQTESIWPWVHRHAQADRRLGGLVEDVLEQDPFCESLFVFCNRGRDKLKMLLWQHNGFWCGTGAWSVRRFRWPQSEAAAIEVARSGWLLDGLISPGGGPSKGGFQVLDSSSS